MLLSCIADGILCWNLSCRWHLILLPRRSTMRTPFSAASGRVLGQTGLGAALVTRGAWERRAHGCMMGTHGQRAWEWYVAMGWERIGAGGKQHGNNGAVLASAWGMGRGRHLPAPSPALPTNYTNSTATAPSAEAKGPGGRGACGEPRGAWCRRLGRRGEAFRGRVRELGKQQHSPKQAVS